MKRLVICLGASAMLLAACGGGDEAELAQWMTESSRNLKGVVKPLPEVKPYEPVAYAAADQIEPFQMSRLDPDRKINSGHMPDMKRPRETLESFPLESIRMVGTIRRDGATNAVVQVDKNVFQIKVGNHMGENFGIVTGISESEVTLKELVQDGTGDWTERVSTIQLQETRQKEARK
jgi:type IV pilus assembly protein PilP